LSPQMFQSLRLMGLPVVDLREEIVEELEKNPALEMVADKSTVSLDSALAPRRREEYDRFRADSDPGFVRRNGAEAAEARHRFIEGVLTRPETLQEHLLWQLALEPVDGEIRRVAEVLIQNLDDDGFNKVPVERLFEARPPEAYGLKAVPEPEQIAAAAALVQRLDPRGTCTSGYRESLAVQAALLPDAPPGLLDAVNRLDILKRGGTASAERRLGLAPGEAAAVLERLKELSPYPGRSFSASGVRYVIPDVQVVKREGDFVILLNDEEIPVLGINPFLAGLAGGNGGEQARDFARKNIKQAEWFLNSLRQRNQTLLKVSHAIVEFQRPFFLDGPKHLAPLTLSDIARELRLHETTISRTANGKYMQTEWGIFELRHFFTNSISGAGSGGSRFSKAGVKEIIREMMTGRERPRSDREITSLLARRGISLARRTVAKYRQELSQSAVFK